MLVYKLIRKVGKEVGKTFSQMEKAICVCVQNHRTEPIGATLGVPKVKSFMFKGQNHSSILQPGDETSKRRSSTSKTTKPPSNYKD